MRMSYDAEWKLNVPEFLKDLVLRKYHGWTGHSGPYVTYRSIQTRFYWFNMQQDIRQ